MCRPALEVAHLAGAQVEREAAAGGMLPVAHLAVVRVEREEEAAAGGILLRAVLRQ